MITVGKTSLAPCLSVTEASAKISATRNFSITAPWDREPSNLTRGESFNVVDLCLKIVAQRTVADYFAREIESTSR